MLQMQTPEPRQLKSYQRNWTDMLDSTLLFSFISIRSLTLMWFKYVRCSLKANFHQQCLGMLMIYMSQDQRLKNKLGYHINFSFRFISVHVA